MVDDEQSRGKLNSSEPIPGLLHAGGSINVGRLGFVIYSIEHPSEADLERISGMEAVIMENPVIKSYLEEHPEEIAEQAPTIAKLTQQMGRESFNRLYRPTS